MTDTAMVSELLNTKAPGADIIRQRYDFWDSLGNIDKDDRRCLDLTRLGIRTIGDRGAMTGPRRYANEQ